MARMLIAHKQRQVREKEEKRSAQHGADVAPPGGVAVISLATVGGGEQRVAAAAVLSIPTAASTDEARRGARTLVSWGEGVWREPSGGGGSGGWATALGIMDKASRIVVYHRPEDAAAMHAIYDGDAARETAHLAKTTDVGWEAWRTTGRICEQRDVMRANGVRGGGTDSGDAECGWWWDGKLAAIERSCRARARALARVVLATEVRLPGGHATREAAIERAIVRRSTAAGKQRARASDESGERRGAPRARAGAGDGETTPALGERAQREPHEAGPPHELGGPAGAVAGPTEGTIQKNGANGEGNDGSPSSGNQSDTGRSKRKRDDGPISYDETARRATRRQRVVYLTTAHRRASAKRDTIQAGVATLERTVGGRYRWRDAAMAPAKRRRGRVLFEQTGAVDGYIGA